MMNAMRRHPDHIAVWMSCWWTRLAQALQAAHEAVPMRVQAAQRMAQAAARP